ncbi:MAG: L,D-transpeptidase [Anaerolineales bacterium]|nr:L,D-transpeptidase [Anaerolineales bacterium]
MYGNSPLNRREFLKLGGLALGAAALPPSVSSALKVNPRYLLQEPFPQAERLGRVVEELDRFVYVRSAPNREAPEVGQLMGDTVVPWIREVVGSATGLRNQRWIEIPQGYVWAPFLQPVKNIVNEPLTSLPDYSGGGGNPGMWMEVTQPYVDVQLVNANAPYGHRIRFLVQSNWPIRLYYGQVMWVDDIRTNDAGETEYHVFDLYGSLGDHFWAPARAFKPIHPEDISPISPEVENKEIVINIARQTMSCYENGREVHFSRVSTGRDSEEGIGYTPVSDYLRVYMKYISTTMTGGTSGAGYDLAGIGWCTFIATGGIAVHTCYWHNNYGERTSAGCVNATQEDAKFIFRWTAPQVDYFPGKIDQIAGTSVRVVQA